MYYYQIKVLVSKTRLSDRLNTKQKLRNTITYTVTWANQKTLA